MWRKPLGSGGTEYVELISNALINFEKSRSRNSQRVITLLIPSGPIGLSWYTSERNPTLNMDSGSSTEGLAPDSFFTFGGVGSFGGLGILGAFSFLALEGLLFSIGTLGSGFLSSGSIGAPGAFLTVFGALCRSGRAVLFSIIVVVERYLSLREVINQENTCARSLTQA